MLVYPHCSVTALRFFHDVTTTRVEVVDAGIPLTLKNYSSVDVMSTCQRERQVWRVHTCHIIVRLAPNYSLGYRYSLGID